MYSSYIENVGQFATIRQAEKAKFKRLDIRQPAVIRVLKGKKLVHFDDHDQVFEANGGEAAFLGAEQILNITNILGQNKFYEAEIFIFDFMIIEDALTSGKLAQSTERTSVQVVPISDGLWAAFDTAKQAMLEPSAFPETVSRHKVEELVLWLAAAGVQFLPAKPRDLAYNVRSLISSDCSRDWKATEVAKKFAFSEATFRRRLQALGCSFSEIVSEIRMAQALFLLQSSDLSILQIAGSVGYSSPSKFAMRFKSRFDISPSQIRGSEFDQIGTGFERNGSEERI